MERGEGPAAPASTTADWALRPVNTADEHGRWSATIRGEIRQFSAKLFQRPPSRAGHQKQNPINRLTSRSFVEAWCNSVQKCQSYSPMKTSSLILTLVIAFAALGLRAAATSTSFEELQTVRDFQDRYTGGKLKTLDDFEKRFPVNSTTPYRDIISRYDPHDLKTLNDFQNRYKPSELEACRRFASIVGDGDVKAAKGYEGKFGITDLATVRDFQKRYKAADLTVIKDSMNRYSDVQRRSLAEMTRRYSEKELGTIRDFQTRYSGGQLKTVQDFQNRAENQRITGSKTLEARATTNPLQTKQAEWMRSLPNPRDQHTGIQAMKNLEDYRYNAVKNLSKPMGITGAAGKALGVVNSGYHDISEMKYKHDMKEIKNQTFQKEFDYKNPNLGVKGHSRVTFEKAYEPGKFDDYMSGKTRDTVNTRETYTIQTPSPTYTPPAIPSYQRSYTPSYVMPARTYSPPPAYRR